MAPSVEPDKEIRASSFVIVHIPDADLAALARPHSVAHHHGFEVSNLSVHLTDHVTRMRAKRNVDKALMSVLPMIARARVAQLQTECDIFRIRCARL